MKQLQVKEEQEEEEEQMKQLQVTQLQMNQQEEEQMKQKHPWFNLLNFLYICAIFNFAFHLLPPESSRQHPMMASVREGLLHLDYTRAPLQMRSLFRCLAPNTRLHAS